jgi:tripartite ATP-independent transporter DctP family solute receptor
VVGLAYWDHGFRNLTNNRRAVARAEDFQGLKIRVAQSPMIINTINGLGANATPMSFTELYGALEAKAVDGQENPTSVIETNKFYEVQKYLTLSRHQYNPLIVIASRKMWDQLTADERKILTDAAVEARAYQRTVSRDMDGKALVSLKSQGMQVTEISDAERKNIIEKLKPVSEKLAKDIGEPLVKQVRAEIDRIRSLNK